MPAAGACLLHCLLQLDVSSTGALVWLVYDATSACNLARLLQAGNKNSRQRHFMPRSSVTLQSLDKAQAIIGWPVLCQGFEG